MHELADRDRISFTRRDVLLTAGETSAAAALPTESLTSKEPHNSKPGKTIMSYIKTKDGTELYYNDWGPRDGQAIVFHLGWPLSADDWDNQMLFFLGKGFRIIAYLNGGNNCSE